MSGGGSCGGINCRMMRMPGLRILYPGEWKAQWSSLLDWIPGNGRTCAQQNLQASDMVRLLLNNTMPSCVVSNSGSCASKAQQFHDDGLVEGFVSLLQSYMNSHSANIFLPLFVISRPQVFTNPKRDLVGPSPRSAYVT